MASAFRNVPSEGASSDMLRHENEFTALPRATFNGAAARADVCPAFLFFFLRLISFLVATKFIHHLLCLFDYICCTTQ